jgi:hypothetical protein
MASRAHCVGVVCVLSMLLMTVIPGLLVDAVTVGGGIVRKETFSVAEDQNGNLFNLSATAAEGNVTFENLNSPHSILDLHSDGEVWLNQGAKLDYEDVNSRTLTLEVGVLAEADLAGMYNMVTVIQRCE